MPDLDTLLRSALADGKLAGGEKTALLAFAQQHLATDQSRSVARSRVFAVAREAHPGAAAALAFVEEALKALAPGAGPGAAPDQAFFSPGDACLTQIVSRFNACRQSADVCVFTVTDDRITRALLAAHKRGVAVRLITDNDKAGDLGSDIAQIEAAGVPVRVDRTPYHMHHKFALFDGRRLLNGSYNWTRGAAEQNEENLIDTGDPALVAAFARQFAALWDALG
jgi:phosphatidylserine/phosphatidylglycerophosphate/cardiolipin synthase-like enzyme